MAHRRGYFRLAIPRRFAGVDFVAITEGRKSHKRGTAKRRRGAAWHEALPFASLAHVTRRGKGRRR